MMEAEGYHGIFPGRYLRRCKIGLSRNPQMRLDTFHSNQPPCNIKILKTIYVENMELVESELHQKFKHCNVKLLKSREWFDLSPVDFIRVNWEFSKYETHQISLSEIPVKAVLAVSFIIISAGLMLSKSSEKPMPAKPGLQRVIK
nr:GIY-YIG nuclease family protein [Calothrix sp. FACHB-1219]